MTGTRGAFRELTEPHRRELQVHCYRILGSVQDAEDMVQETLLAAWRGLEAFEGRASVRSWLYRIATNRCLNALRSRARRPKEVQVMTDALEPTRLIEPVWLEPYPDALLEGLADALPGPDARYETRESIELGFIVALQALPPRQRAALVLRDVLGFPTAEVAEMLDTGSSRSRAPCSVPGRARAACRRGPRARAAAATPPGAPAGRALRRRRRERRHRRPVVSLLTEDARLTMPPLPLEYQGHAAIGAFLRHREELRGRPLRLVPTRANTQPAFGCYLPDAQTAIAHAYALFVLTLEGDRVSAITWFGDRSVFPHFGLPHTLRG